MIVKIPIYFEVEISATSEVIHKFRDSLGTSLTEFIQTKAPVNYLPKKDFRINRNTFKVLSYNQAVTKILSGEKHQKKDTGLVSNQDLDI